jgi:hypothetical protein
MFFPFVLILFFYSTVKGVAVGCGWQAMVAYINIGCYYFIGVPLGVLLGFKFDFGIKVRLIHGPPAPHVILSELWSIGDCKITVQFQLILRGKWRCSTVSLRRSKTQTG